MDGEGCQGVWGDGSAVRIAGEGLNPSPALCKHCFLLTWERRGPQSFSNSPFPLQPMALHIVLFLRVFMGLEKKGSISENPHPSPFGLSESQCLCNTGGITKQKNG